MLPEYQVSGLQMNSHPMTFAPKTCLEVPECICSQPQ